MHKRLGLILVIALLLCAALVATGCGGDDSSNDDSSAPAAEAQEQGQEQAEDLPSDAEGLKDRCMEELQQTGQSEEEAEKMCTVPDEAEVDEAVEAALESCLSVVKQLPDSERAQAEQDCKDSAK